MRLRPAALVSAACCAVLIFADGCAGSSPVASGPARSGLAGSTSAGPAASELPGTAASGLARLVELAAQRLATADTVAASKWASGGSINDPAREKVVLDGASTGAAQRHLDRCTVTAVFRDQIEANKAVQYGLFSGWSADPSRAPASAPDLTQVRPVLDRITGQLLDALVAVHATDPRSTAPNPTAPNPTAPNPTAPSASSLGGDQQGTSAVAPPPQQPPCPVDHSGAGRSAANEPPPDPGCMASLRRATDDAERDEHLDDLHRRGLERAFRSLCR